ncbi:MAG: hypothetical protein KGL53_03550, partial [Elusimicrobia bacterium]|nr:hypothetical protein [Elusimicrobiota bacterium]
AALFLMFQAEWAVFAAGAGLTALAWRQSPRLGKRAFWACAAGAAAAAGLALWLGFTPSVALAQARYRADARLGGVSVRAWLWNQYDSLSMNFDDANTAAAGALVLAAAATPFAELDMATLLGLVILFAGLAWLTVFRNLAFTHHYAQWYLGPAYVLLAAGALVRLKRRLPGPEVRRWAFIVLAPLLALTLHDSHDFERRILERTFGQAEDLSHIWSRRERVVWDETGASGPWQWWVSPNIVLYTDPVYKARALGIRGARGGEVRLGDVRRFEPGRDVLVTLAKDDAVRFAVRRLERQVGRPLRLEVVDRSPSFVFLEAVR